jgi:TPR repeat protein
LINARTHALLRERFSPRGARLVQVVRYLGVIGASMALFGMLGLITAMSEEALGLLQKACHRGSTRSCNVLGHVAKDAIHACDADNGPQCLVAGFVHLQGTSMPPVNGPTIPADPSKAKADFAKSCRLGVKSACSR